MKKENYLKWDEYFMGIALLSAERSKDPHTSVGACIVSEDNKMNLMPNIFMSAMLSLTHY